MNLNHLQTFVIVAEEANLTRAAERLYLSPPTVSSHISALEAELQLQLFERTSRGMLITEGGRQLQTHAGEILSATTALISRARTLRETISGEVSIGLNASAAFLRMPELVAGLRNTHPAIRLQFIDAPTGRIVEDLHCGRLDMGTLFGALPEGLAAVQMTQAALVIAAPVAWSDCIQEAEWADLAALPWIIQDDVLCPFQDMVNDLFCTRGLAYQIAVLASSEGTKLDLVRQGIGLALLEQTEAQAAAARGEIVLWKGVSIPCDLHLATLAARAYEPALRVITEKVKELW